MAKKMVDNLGRFLLLSAFFIPVGVFAEQTSALPSSAKFLTTSSATATYLSLSSAAATYLQQGQSSGGSDNLGSHVATKTITAGFGISATTGVFSSSVVVGGQIVTGGFFDKPEIVFSNTTNDFGFTGAGDAIHVGDLGAPGLIMRPINDGGGFWCQGDNCGYNSSVLSFGYTSIDSLGGTGFFGTSSYDQIGVAANNVHVASFSPTGLKMYTPISTDNYDNEQITVISTSGYVTVYKPSDSSTDKGTKLISAICDGSDGDTIILGPGIYSTTAGFDLDCGDLFTKKSIIGAGRHQTRLVGSGFIWTVKPASFSYIANLSMEGPDLAGFGGPLSTNVGEVVMENVYVQGKYDAFAVSGTGKYFIYDSHFASTFDAIAFSGQSATSELNCFNCLMVSTADATSNDIDGFYMAEHGIANFYSPRVLLQGGTGRTCGFYSSGSTARTNVYGGSIEISSGTNRIDLQRDGGSIYVSNDLVHYSTRTVGTINYLNQYTTAAVKAIRFADGTVQESAASGSGGDNLGTHIATKTIVANYGIGATTGVFSSEVYVSSSVDWFSNDFNVLKFGADPNTNGSGLPLQFTWSNPDSGNNWLQVDDGGGNRQTLSANLVGDSIGAPTFYSPTGTIQVISPTTISATLNTSGLFTGTTIYASSVTVKSGNNHSQTGIIGSTINFTNTSGGNSVGTFMDAGTPMWAMDTVSSEATLDAKTNFFRLQANGLPMFRGVTAQTNIWTDAASLVAFQIGGSGQNILYSALNGTLAPRTMWWGSAFQYSSNNTASVAPVPQRFVEWINGTTPVVSFSGNGEGYFNRKVIVGSTTTYTGSASLNVYGTILSTTGYSGGGTGWIDVATATIAGIASISTTTFTGADKPFSRTIAQLNASTYAEAGLRFFCSDCTQEVHCVSTGTAAGSISSLHDRTNHCN